MLLQALRVEIVMKNLNIQVTFLVQKGVGTQFLRVSTPLHPWLFVRNLAKISKYCFQKLARNTKTKRHNWP